MALTAEAAEAQEKSKIHWFENHSFSAFSGVSAVKHLFLNIFSLGEITPAGGVPDGALRTGREAVNRPVSARDV